MTPSIYLSLEHNSTAVDAIVLTPRLVQFAWKSGSVSAHRIRLRDQIHFYFRHLLIDPELSYGTWANWVLDNQL